MVSSSIEDEEITEIVNRGYILTQPWLDKGEINVEMFLLLKQLLITKQLLACLPGSVSKARDSWPLGCEFNLHVGHEAHLKKEKKLKKLQNNY